MCVREGQEGRQTGAGVSKEGLPSPKGTDQQSFAVYTIEAKFLMKLPEKNAGSGTVANGHSSAS